MHSRYLLTSYEVATTAPTCSPTHAEPLGTLVTGTQIESDNLTRADYLSTRSKFNGPGVGAELLFGSMLRNILQQLMGEDLYLVRHQHSHFDRVLCLLMVRALTLLHNLQFNEQYIVKTPHAGEESKFVMHQVRSGLSLCGRALCLFTPWLPSNAGQPVRA